MSKNEQSKSLTVARPKGLTIRGSAKNIDNISNKYALADPIQQKNSFSSLWKRGLRVLSFRGQEKKMKKRKGRLNNNEIFQRLMEIKKITVQAMAAHDRLNAEVENRILISADYLDKKNRINKTDEAIKIVYDELTRFLETAQQIFDLAEGLEEKVLQTDKKEFPGFLSRIQSEILDNERFELNSLEESEVEQNEILQGVDALKGKKDWTFNIINLKHLKEAFAYWAEQILLAAEEIKSWQIESDELELYMKSAEETIREVGAEIQKISENIYEALDILSHIVTCRQLLKERELIPDDHFTFVGKAKEFKQKQEEIISFSKRIRTLFSKSLTVKRLVTANNFIKEELTKDGFDLERALASLAEQDEMINAGLFTDKEDWLITIGDELLKFEQNIQCLETAIQKKVKERREVSQVMINPLARLKELTTNKGILQGKFSKMKISGDLAETIGLHFSDINAKIEAFSQKIEKKSFTEEEGKQVLEIEERLNKIEALIESFDQVEDTFQSLAEDAASRFWHLKIADPASSTDWCEMMAKFRERGDTAARENDYPLLLEINEILRRAIDWFTQNNESCFSVDTCAGSLDRQALAGSVNFAQKAGNVWWAMKNGAHPATPEMADNLLSRVSEIFNKLIDNFENTDGISRLKWQVLLNEFLHRFIEAIPARMTSEKQEEMVLSMYNMVQRLLATYFNGDMEALKQGSTTKYSSKVSGLLRRASEFSLQDADLTGTYTMLLDLFQEGLMSPEVRPRQVIAELKEIEKRMDEVINR